MARTPKADYRPLIEEAALRRLVSGSEVTIASIAAELQISPGLVHFYCGSREELVAAAWRRVLDAYVYEDQERIAQGASGGDWEIVERLADEAFASDRDGSRRAHVRMVGDSFQSEVLAKLVHEHTCETVRNWKGILEMARDFGTVSTPLDLEALAMLIVGLPLGVTALGIDLTPEQRDHLAEAWSTMLQAVMRPDFDLDSLRKPD